MLIIKEKDEELKKIDIIINPKNERTIFKIKRNPLE